MLWLTLCILLYNIKYSSRFYLQYAHSHKIIINQLETMEMFCIWFSVQCFFFLCLKIRLRVLYQRKKKIFIQLIRIIFYHVCLLMRSITILLDFRTSQTILIWIKLSAFSLHSFSRLSFFCEYTKSFDL